MQVQHYMSLLFVQEDVLGPLLCWMDVLKNKTDRAIPQSSTKLHFWGCSEDLFLFRSCSVEKGLCVPHYLRLFMPCSIRWTLPAIFIITELLCVEPLRGPWQLTATGRRCVCKWLGSGQKGNVLVMLHGKPLSWNSDSQQLYPWQAYKKLPDQFGAD